MTQTDKTLNQEEMPFLASLLKEKQQRQTSFHMPGHKGTLAPHPMLLEYWGGDVQPADLVEIIGIIDYLHAPKDKLLEAQKLAAQAQGADQTFFLINGSTVGNITSIMGTAFDGEKVIMPRASHRSVYGGVVLSGAIPVYVPPDYHPQVGFPLATDTQVVARLFQEHQIRAIHVTSPNYYGYLSDVRQLAEMAHAHGAMMLVDEAHGSHLAFHEALPHSATQLGADVIVQSTHKTQGALTQCSMLHLNHGRVNAARIAQILGLLQTSSPSSILLASLDAARQFMATQGRALLEEVYQLSVMAREAIRQIDGLWCYGEDLLGSHGIFDYDPTKLVIRVSDTGWNGFEFYQLLRKEYGIDGEFSDLKHVICSLTIGDTELSVMKLLNALKSISEKPSGKPVRDYEVTPPAALPEMALSPREAYFVPSKPVRLDTAMGQICAENIIPYPPGIPLLVPGEVINPDTVDYMRFIMSMGGGVVGPEDKRLETIRVIA